MLAVHFLFYTLAGVCFGLAAGGVVVRRFNFVALGLLFWVFVPFLQTLVRL